MNKEAAARARSTTVQEACIDLPGEAVKCWRSSDKVKVILRKHRDVIFDINLTPGVTYTVESISDFYSPREKKLSKKVGFQDGERFHIWIGRNFKGTLVLKSGEIKMGSYEANKLDAKEYDANPKTKPEPLMVIFGKKPVPNDFSCPGNDPLWWSDAQKIFKPMYDPLVSSLKNYGTEYDYTYPIQPPEVEEYVAVAEAIASEIQPQVLMQLNSGLAVEGKVTEIFNLPHNCNTLSDLYTTIKSSTIYIAGSKFVTSNEFKEPAGYLKENWKALDKILMRVRIEKRVIGKYRVIFKGRPLVKSILVGFGAAANARTIHKTVVLGSHESAFLDGGYKRTGRAGFGGAKRLMLTLSENFRAGAKIQGIGTVIDIFGDAVTVYSDEQGSKDLTEFLGRAGVSLLKAAATAAIGSMVAALLVGLLAAAGVVLPVALVALLIIVGYILVANLVDLVDEKIGLKDSVAGWAK